VEPLTIGRNHRNDIVLLDRSISRKHAEVKKEEEGFFITDLSSGGGIEINGEKTKRTALKPGDEISIGDFRLVFKEEMGY
jgi:pSer/pThr/pTyr-binding forkhead associated (FHA) protein